MRPSARLGKLGAPALALTIIGGLAATGGAAVAQDARVRSACAGDYHRYCPSYPVGSTKLRSCMRAVGKRLTPQCLDALVATGEISRKQARR